MDKKFLMGNNDWLVRSRAAKVLSTAISPSLRTNLMTAAMRRACQFYSDFFGISISNVAYNKLIVEYERDLSHATALRLFGTGSIHEKDHLNLWCLGRIFAPEVYVESGVFIGSSLHAFINSPGIEKILAIDPDLSNLKLPAASIPEVELIDDKDFSQLRIDFSGRRALAYFDDHINTADRIVQACQKGFRYVLFDDSTGLEGICQRLYPAIPTIPMIMNAEMLNPGDELSWTFGRASALKFEDLIKRIFGKKVKAGGTRVALVVTEELIEECFEAKKLIKKFRVLPDLGEFIPQYYPGRTMDTSKFLVELDQT